MVGEAENGQRAIELYKELKPDLVTMDITMPELDGISALKGNPRHTIPMLWRSCAAPWGSKRWSSTL